MNVNRLITLTGVFLFLSSCKKDYGCVCTDPSGIKSVALYHTTRKKATDNCTAYYNENYGSGWTEASCKIK